MRQQGVAVRSERAVQEDWSGHAHVRVQRGLRRRRQVVHGDLPVQLAGLALPHPRHLLAPGSGQVQVRNLCAVEIRSAPAVNALHVSVLVKNWKRDATPKMLSSRGAHDPQAHQLGAFGDNVQAFRVQGSFDDCQAMVKRAFSDPDLRARVTLITANSISLGRLLPQMAYYVDASLRWRAKHGTAVNLIIPSGNLGNGLGAVMARAIGAPIAQICLASNANRVLSDYLNTGVYQPQASLATLANAMDVGAPSNFERLQHLFPMLSDVLGVTISDAEIAAQVQAAPENYGHIICPHTACAFAAYEHIQKHNPSSRWLIAATAHPAKFDEIVEPLIGQAITIPPELAKILAKPTHAELLAAEGLKLLKGGEKFGVNANGFRELELGGDIASHSKIRVLVNPHWNNA